MSVPRITKAMDHVDDDLISGAVAYKRTKKKNVWVKCGIMAACLCLAASGTVFWQNGNAAKPVEEDPDIVPTENGVTIPKMEISLSSNGGADMVGFFIYHGNCYVQYEWIYDVDIVGEYLGTATGLIDEWTPREGYVELAGSVTGDFFAVKGYDPAFMLCMMHEPGTVSTYVCNNGITLKYGSELYEDRLHLSEHYNAVQYETRESWYHGKDELYQVNGTNEVINSFIEQLDKAEFIFWEDVTAKEEGYGTSIHDTEIYHLYFKMANGTTIHLRLYENGCVRFWGINDVCVQVPEDSFNSLIDFMNDHTDAEPIAITDSNGR